MADTNKPEAPHLDRRMLAIMATDVVGFSRQMEQDEVGTLARVTAARVDILEPLLERHRGRLIKLMGDGSLSVFDSVVDAVNCAAAIQRTAAERNKAVKGSDRLVMRIGINVGDVVLQDNDVYGDGVNVAARIEPLCEPGGIMVSGTAFDHLQGKVDFPLEFAGEQQVKNISRPVRAYRARLDGVASAPPPTPLRRTLSVSLRSLTAGVLAVVLGVAGWWFWSTWSAPTARASVAVLPFDNLGGDEATGRLADGMTEDLITELTRFRALDVIARDATLAYKDKAVDVRQVGQALHVRYILDGAIQRQGERVRISARLVDTTTARDVWSERWDRPTNDVFAVQSELAETVASKIAGPYSGEIIAVDREAAKRKPPSSLTAYDLYLLGMESQGHATRESLQAAIPLLQRSLAIDPNFARAWTGLAVTYAGLADIEEYPADIQQAREAAARKGVALDPGDAQAHAALATYYMDSGDAARAEAEFDKALRLNPGSADLLSIYAGWASNFGEPEKGVDAAERAMRLNPDTPPLAMYNFAYAYFMVGRYADALRIFDRMPVDAYPPSAYIYRAATLGALGKHEAAKQAVDVALKYNPNLSIETWVAGHASNPDEHERLIDSMRKAGFPVCAGPDAIKAATGVPRLPECAAS